MSEEENKVKRLTVNLDGWFISNSGERAFSKGHVIDLVNIKNDIIKKRVLEAYRTGEEGYCRKEKKRVPVVIKSMTRQDIIDDTLDEVTEKLVRFAEEKLSQDDIISFRDELRAITKKKNPDKNKVLKKKSTSGVIKTKVKKKSNKAIAN